MKFGTFAFILTCHVPGMALDNLRGRPSKSGFDKDYDKGDVDDNDDVDDDNDNASALRLKKENGAGQYIYSQQNRGNYTTSTCFGSTVDPVRKVAHVDFRGDGQKFVSYPSGYLFDRRPALQAFRFDVTESDALTASIGVQAETDGVDFQFQPFWRE